LGDGGAQIADVEAGGIGESIGSCVGGRDFDRSHGSSGGDGGLQRGLRGGGCRRLDAIDGRGLQRAGHGAAGKGNGLGEGGIDVVFVGGLPGLGGVAAEVERGGEGSPIDGEQAAGKVGDGLVHIRFRDGLHSLAAGITWACTWASVACAAAGTIQYRVLVVPSLR